MCLYLIKIYNKYYRNNLMQPNQLLDTRKRIRSISNESDDEQSNFTFQWATHMPFKSPETLKLYYVNSIIKNNSKHFTNCLIYVKDKSQQEHLKSSIQKQTRLLVKCCSSNELLNLGDQFSKAKIFIVSIDGNVTYKYFIPRCFDLVFFFQIPKLEDYEKLVRKQIKSPTKFMKCGLVINCYSFTADEKIVAQFVEKAKVKTNTYQQLMKQMNNLSQYFKLEDISLENKNSQKSQQDIIKSPEVQNKIQTENIQSTKSKRNLNWATYLIVSTEQNYKSGRTHNYIRYCSKFNCCIVYSKTESRVKFILQRLPQQIKNQTSILLNYPKNYMEYLKKLQQKQIRILIIVANNQDFQSNSSQFYVPSTVNLIISDNMPTRQLFKQRFGKIKQTNQGGLIISMLTNHTENDEFRNYCKQYGVKVNDQHRKDDYDLDKYIKPPLDNIQRKIKDSKSPEKTESSLNKNNQNIAKKQTANQTNQSLPKTQQSQLQLANKTGVNSSIGGAGEVKIFHTQEQDPQQNKAEKKQQKEQNASSSPPKQKEVYFCSRAVNRKFTEQVLEKRRIERTQSKDQPKSPAEVKIEQPNSNHPMVVQPNNNKPTTMKTEPQMLKPLQNLKQDINPLPNNPAHQQQIQYLKTVSTKQLQLSDKLDQLPKQIQQLQANISEKIANSQTTLSKIGETGQFNRKLIKETAAQHKAIMNSELKNINQKQVQIQNKLEQIPGKLQSIENDVKRNLSKQKIQLQDSVRIIKNCVEAQNQKNLVKIGQILKETSQIKTIANEAKQIREALPCISGSIQSIKQNLTNDIKQLQKINTRVEDTQKSNSQGILSKIGEASQFNSKLIKETAGQYKTIINSEFKNINQKQAQIENKLDQVPAKLQSFYNGTSTKLSEFGSKLGKQTKDIEQLLKSQNQNKTIIKVQNRQILNYIDTEKQKITKSNENALQELKTRKQAMESQQKNRLHQFERKLNDKEKTSTGAEHERKLKQLEKKYQQSMAEINSLRTYKVNFVKTSEELDRVKLELSQARKIEAKFNAYKKRFTVQRAIYDNLAAYFAEKQKECDQLKNQISAYKLQLKELGSIRDELNAAKQSIYNFIQAKTQKREPEAGSVNRMILRLIGQYDTLKKYQIGISKYNRELQGTLRALNDKIGQAAKKGTQVSVPKILDFINKQSTINSDLQQISENVNRLLSNLNSKTAQFVKANQLIEELKKQNTTQSTIITGLIGDKNILTAQLKQAKETVTRLQTEHIKTQNDLATMTANYKKAQAVLVQTKTTLGQTQTSLKNTKEKLQQITSKLSKTENALKQTAAELSTTKAVLQQKQKQASTKRQSQATNYADITKQLRRALQDQKTRAQEQADAADKNIQDLRKTIVEATKHYKDLEQKSKRQIEDERKKYQQQLQRKENEIREIKLENENQRAKLLGQMKQFQELLNKSIKSTLEYESKVTINNYKDELPNLSRAMMQRQSRSKFLAESSTYRHINEEDRLFVFESIKIVVNRKIDYTKTLFEGYQGANFYQWLLKIYGRPNLLVLVTLSNGHVIGGFSENAFSKEKVTKGKGYMMSITNKRIYDIKSKYEGKVAKYDDLMFIFGNNELIIRSNLSFAALFGRQFCYFQAGDDRVQDFLGQEQEEGTFKSVEFHQVIFS